MVDSVLLLEGDSGTGASLIGTCKEDVEWSWRHIAVPKPKFYRFLAISAMRDRRTDAPETPEKHVVSGLFQILLVSRHGKLITAFVFHVAGVSFDVLEMDPMDLHQLV